MEEKGDHFLCRNESTGAKNLWLLPTCNYFSRGRFECILLGRNLLSAPYFHHLKLCAEEK